MPVAVPPDRPSVVGIVMGSASDLGVMRAALDVLQGFGVPCEIGVRSAHRDPHAMLEYGATAADRGLKVLIAGAGGAAHLPGMVAAATTLPVIGVPIALSVLDGLDSLLSIVQMPRGVPVATVAIGNATNAALLAARILALADPVVAMALSRHQAELTAAAHLQDEDVGSELTK